MKILLVGSGAREHALARALARSPQEPEIYCFANSYNPGILELATAYVVGDLCSVEDIFQQALQWKVHLALIGPEAPLEQGLADALAAQAIPSMGPKRRLAQIETSKAFARTLLEKHKMFANPEYRVFSGLSGVQDYLRYLGQDNYVIKANGLAGGKGVKVAGDHLKSLAEAYQYCVKLDSQNQNFIIEEKLEGEEFSLLCFSDGKRVIPMPLVQDYKRAFVANLGPNTGGMGSYTAADHRLPFLTEAEVKEALHINELTLAALQEDYEEPYVGVLYGGFMATREGLRLIEFNARFGDPEALNLLSLLESDFVSLCQALVTGTLHADLVRFEAQATVCKYAVPDGYPDQPHKNAVVDLSEVKNKEQLYLAALNKMDNKLYTSTSRAAAVVGKAATLPEAEKIAETEIRSIKGALYHREDIGKAELIEASVERMRQLRSQAEAKAAGELT